MGRSAARPWSWPSLNARRVLGSCPEAALRWAHRFAAGCRRPDRVVPAGREPAGDTSAGPRAVRTLALLTGFRGAKRGANDYRVRATPGHMQPSVPRPNGTSGHMQHRPGTLRKCLLSSRSRVRVAVGAQVKDYLSLLISSLDDLLRSTARRQSLVSGHFAMPGNVRRRPATGEMDEDHVCCEQTFCPDVLRGTKKGAKRSWGGPE